MISSNLKPFLFLIISLAVSESFLFLWMIIIASTTTTERIVVGALSITILIAVLVISCVIYWIRMNSELENNKMKHERGDHGIGTTFERTAITSEWSANLLYYDIGEQLWYYNSNDDAPQSVTWTLVEYPRIKKNKLHL